MNNIVYNSTDRLCEMRTKGREGVQDPEKFAYVLNGCPLGASPERDRSWHATGRPWVTVFPSSLTLCPPASPPIQTAAELIRQTLRKGEERTPWQGYACSRFEDKWP